MDRLTYNSYGIEKGRKENSSHIGGIQDTRYRHERRPGVPFPQSQLARDAVSAPFSPKKEAE